MPNVNDELVQKNVELELQLESIRKALIEDSGLWLRNILSYSNTL